MSPRPRDTMNKFGKVIARLLNDERLHKGVTQAELAESTGISQSQISKQLRGTRDINIDELDAIVTALNMSLVELIRTAEQEISPDTRNELEERRRKARMSNPSDSMPEGAVAYSGPDEDAERNDVDDD
ncbi:helix-turn-helix domain-containing protein [Corynebacterium kefirresidentii]|uniref:helix-turn-helix domain-containing protein n=1 Tax=Corynebacterium kefirresidentii TaxID=1979527 RepID=UPI003736AF2C